MSFQKKTITILTGLLLSANALFAFNKQDTLRGSNGVGRAWWDVQHYSLSFNIDTLTRSINGTNTIKFKITDANISDSMQIDLQEPMILDEALFEGEKKMNFVREGNVYWITGFKEKIGLKSDYSITLSFHGKPRQAVNPPWDGGLIWTKDSLGNPWVSVACQGLGASSWWPCKDYQGDEPDAGMEIIPLPRGYDIISNGQLNAGQYDNYDSQFHWLIKNPINTYDATFYLGDYAPVYDTFQGKKGILNITYNPLRYNEARAKEQFKQVKKMLEAFEYWFGPYPFYEDGYKIVEAPFLGMEHQGAIAYGNKYQNGYLGKDRSGTGVGMLFDFIIVHESGHEWFGNSITAADIADNWIHEGFTTYSETLFAEYWFGKGKAFQYCRGEWKNIKNDKPVIGTYGVSDAGSGDKYDKGSAVVHTIRLMMDDDEKFRAMLHKMNDTFYHKQITSKQMEDFIIQFSGLELQPIFDQYLRTTKIPVLEYSFQEEEMIYRLTNIVDEFTLPIRARINGEEVELELTNEWQTYPLGNRDRAVKFLDEFLVEIKKL